MLDNRADPVLAIANSFDPSQPRDDQGRWTDAGGPQFLVSPSTGSLTENPGAREARRQVIGKWNAWDKHPKTDDLRKARPDKYKEFTDHLSKVVEKDNDADMWKMLAKMPENPPDWPGAAAVRHVILQKRDYSHD